MIKHLQYLSFFIVIGLNLAPIHCAQEACTTDSQTKTLQADDCKEESSKTKLKKQKDKETNSSIIPVLATAATSCSLAALAIWGYKKGWFSNDQNPIPSSGQRDSVESRKPKTTAPSQDPQLLPLPAGLDRVKVANALFGAATGDALGRITEFGLMNLSEGPIVHWFNNIERMSFYCGNKLYFHPKGVGCPFTDDTIMAHIVFEEFVRTTAQDESSAKLAVNNMAIRFTGIFNERNYTGFGYTEIDPLFHLRGHGTTAPRSCEIIKNKLKSFDDWEDWRSCQLRPDLVCNERGCGSVMRAWPVGLFCTPENAISVADWQSSITHRHPSAKAACAAIAAGFATLRAGGTFNDVATKMIKTAQMYKDAERAHGMCDHWPYNYSDYMEIIKAGTMFTADMLEYAKHSAEVSLSDPSNEHAQPKAILGSLANQTSGISETGALLGWVGNEAAAAALYIILRHEYTYNPADAERIFKAALSEAVNTVGDSDSIATLVGAFMGWAYNGETPLYELYGADYLERIDWIKQIATTGNVEIRNITDGN